MTKIDYDNKFILFTVALFKQASLCKNMQSGLVRIRKFNHSKAKMCQTYLCNFGCKKFILIVQNYTEKFIMNCVSY